MNRVLKFNHFKISLFQSEFLLHSFDYIKMGISWD